MARKKKTKSEDKREEIMQELKEEKLVIEKVKKPEMIEIELTDCSYLLPEPHGFVTQGFRMSVIPSEAKKYASTKRWKIV